MYGIECLLFPASRHSSPFARPFPAEVRIHLIISLQKIPHQCQAQNQPVTGLTHVS